MPTCSDCSGTVIEYDAAAGNGFCVQCGTVVEENTIVNEVSFGETSNGAAMVMGSYVALGASHARMGGMYGNRGNGGESREQTIANATKKIHSIATILRLSEQVSLTATRLYTLAVEHKFTKGRKGMNVVAVCLYVACRQKETRNYMLIDFSDLLQVNVFELGSTYLALIRTLNLRLPLLDPSHYISRFASLLEFGDLTPQVSLDATRLVQRFSRDWMTLGRRPSGICGAALLLAARMNNFRRSVEEVVQVVKIAEGTLKKRLEEFKVTRSAEMTVGDFRSVWLEEECEPPAFRRAREMEAEANAKNELMQGEQEEEEPKKKKGKGKASGKKTKGKGKGKAKGPESETQSTRRSGRGKKRKWGVEDIDDEDGDGDADADAEGDLDLDNEGTGGEFDAGFGHDPDSIAMPPPPPPKRPPQVDLHLPSSSFSSAPGPSSSCPSTPMTLDNEGIFAGIIPSIQENPLFLPDPDSDVDIDMNIDPALFASSSQSQSYPTAQSKTGIDLLSMGASTNSSALDFNPNIDLADLSDAALTAEVTSFLSSDAQGSLLSEALDEAERERRREIEEKRARAARTDAQLRNSQYHSEDVAESSSTGGETLVNGTRALGPEGDGAVGGSDVGTGTGTTLNGEVESSPEDPEDLEPYNALLGLDEAELDRFLLSEEEVRVKERVWVEMNRDYLEGIVAKGDQTAAKEAKARKRRKTNGSRDSRHPRDTSTPHGSTPAESVRNLIKKNPKYSKRINYEALKDLFVDSPSSSNSFPGNGRNGTSSLVNNNGFGGTGGAEFGGDGFDGADHLYTMDDKDDKDDDGGLDLVIIEEDGIVGAGAGVSMQHGEGDAGGEGDDGELGYGGVEDVGWEEPYEYQQEV